MGGVNSEGETPLDIAEEEAMEELLQNEINRQGACILKFIETAFLTLLPPSFGYFSCQDVMTVACVTEFIKVSPVDTSVFPHTTVEALSLVDVHFLPVRGHRKKCFLPEMACTALCGLSQVALCCLLTFRRSVRYFYPRRYYLPSRSFEEKRAKKVNQLCGASAITNRKGPAFSIFGRGILGMMKGPSPTVRGHAQTCRLARGQRGAPRLALARKALTPTTTMSPPGLVLLHRGQKNLLKSCD